MKNNEWMATFSVIAIVAVVGLVAVLGLSSMTGAATTETKNQGQIDVCDRCFSSCSPQDEFCIAMCRTIPACENIGQPCGPTRCRPGTFCCNPLHGICVDSPHDYCIM